MNLPRYELVNDRFVWRFESDEDKVGTMLCFFFDPDAATDLVGALNAAIAMSVVMIPNEWDPPLPAADVTVESRYGARDPKELIVTKEEMGTLASGGTLNPRSKFYTWDGEPGAEVQ